MANDCSYNMRVVGKTKAAVERMSKILGYKDKEFFLYRVFDMSEASKPVKDGKYWRMDYFGDVAWGPDPWINDLPNSEEKIGTGAHYSNLREICKALGIGVEVWAEEFGNGLQEHFIVNPCGSENVNEGYSDLRSEDDGEGGEQLVGGFGDDFLKWSPVGDIMETCGEECDEEA